MDPSLINKSQEKSLPLHVIHVSTHQSFGTKHPHRSNILGVKARVSDIHHVMVKSRRHVHQNGKKTVHQHKNNHSVSLVFSVISCKI
ncbi:unnamed protein product [Rotaria socialis]|uniref:Uncharacterized protein n=1 Tax=Rotaria socialis TaxID=392032 RepID=A0A818E924_9BILA|nr:unnamed protein product [Rotaria socialis]CAF3238791.1 unnamed protein product [Rotaria socialis]CAF3455738.1 unnamed protein product [Rotaria socialis]CAF3714119.1 unnamed protein product [Rotaria socialis]